MDLFTITIVLTFLGFVALAVALLLPVYFFLRKEERLADAWTEQLLAARTEEVEKVADEEMLNQATDAA